jgi:hypothetical protein
VATLGVSAYASSSLDHFAECLPTCLDGWLPTGELRQGHTRALEALAEGLLPRLRPVLDEVAAVSESVTGSTPSL